MARPLFNRIVTAVTNYNLFFHINTDYTGREGISPLIKCTFAIRQLAYDVNGNFLDEYMQISERSSRMALDHFCEAVMEIYGPEFLRKPKVKENQEKDKIGSKPDKNEKCGEARRSLKQLQLKEEEKTKKTKKRMAENACTD
uniref:Uncharacterized protein n=1 Tax=Tanacetum cinerariifolium TaxID=118510 RepID=A0A699GTW4_TANCI|nr:hypothetical protein [Tanacetum cinerariifolium]